MQSEGLRLDKEVLCYATLDRASLDFFGFDHDDGLVAPPGLCMGEVVLRMRDLGFIGLDAAEDLGALLRQRLDDQGLCHARIAPESAISVQSATWCICYLRPEAFIAQLDHAASTARIRDVSATGSIVLSKCKQRQPHKRNSIAVGGGASATGGCSTGTPAATGISNGKKSAPISGDHRPFFFNSCRQA